MSVRVEGASWRKRFTTAIVVVAAIVAAGPLGDMVIPNVGSGPYAESGETGIRAIELIAGGNADDALARIEERAALGVADGQGAPSGFAAEVGLPPGARDVRTSGPVVGYVVDGACEDALAALRDHMEALGWSCVSLGGIEGATFVKSEGRYTWALATCVQVDGATSVVIRSDR